MNIVAALLSAVLLVLAALLRAASASLLRTPRADALHDAGDGDARAAKVAILLAQRVHLQPATSVVIAALIIGTVASGAWALASLLEGGAFALSLVGLWVAVLIVGDVIPRGLGRARPRTLAYRLSWMLDKAVRLGAAADDWVGEEDEEEDDQEEDDDEEEERDREERELITSVLEFSETLVREVMIPRTDIVMVPMSATSDDALDVFVETGLSRVPVSGASADDIIGLVFSRDFLRLTDQGRAGVPITEFMRPVYFVPETKRVSDLLRAMQVQKTHMAIVVDEYGGTAGLVTIEDLLEELVGEIEDEFDEAEELVRREGDGVFYIDARLPVEDLGELLGVELPSEEWDTVGGLVLGLAGRVPNVGESFEEAGHDFRTVRVQGRRVAEVRVERLTLHDDPEAE
jgi:CBS domain containing-hemolysin-like protein